MKVCVSNHDKSFGHLTTAWIQDLEGNQLSREYIWRPLYTSLVSWHLTVSVCCYCYIGNVWGRSRWFECGIVFGVEVALGYEEICSDFSGNRVFIWRKHRYMKLIRPFTMEKRLMSRLRREKMYMEENMFSPFPSHCNSFRGHWFYWWYKSN